MSDSYDQYLDALTTDEAPEEPRERPQRASRETRSASAARKAAASAEAPPGPRDEPRGKRAKEGFVQVNASVPQSIKASAMAYLGNEEKHRVEKVYSLKVQPLEDGYAPRSLSDLMEQLLEAWVASKGGDLFGGKR